MIEQNAFKLNQELKNYGFETEETRQGALTLSPALKDLKRNVFRWENNI